jgi:hypothetical protein
MPAEIYPPLLAPAPDCRIDYSLPDKTIVVTRCGRICLKTKKSISARCLTICPFLSPMHNRAERRALWKTLVAIGVLSTHNGEKNFGIQNLGRWDGQDIF